MSFHSTKSSRRWYRTGARARASVSGVEPSGAVRSPEPLDRRHDLRLPAAGSAALAERGSRPRASVRPVELDDLHRELPRGEEVWRGAVTGGVLEAEVEEGEKDGVLVRGGEAALVEEPEDALGEGEGGVGVGEQRGILGGGAEEVSRARGNGLRCDGARLGRRLEGRIRRLVVQFDNQPASRRNIPAARPAWRAEVSAAVMRGRSTEGRSRSTHARRRFSP